MRLNKVPILNDYPEHRGSFIQSTASNDVAFLDASGKMILLNRAVTTAVLCLFDELNNRSVESISMLRWLALTKEAKKIFADYSAVKF